MSKTKMRCITCGKWFQSANAKEVTCPECVQKARKDKLASKAIPPATSRPPVQGMSGSGTPARPVMPPKQKPAPGSTSHWFDSLNDVKVSEPEPPPRPRMSSSPATRDAHGGPNTASRGPNSYHDERPQGNQRGPGSYRDERGSYRGHGSHRDERGPSTTGYRSPSAYRDMPLSGSIANSIGQRPRQPMEGGVPPGRGPRPAGLGGDRRINRYNVSGSEKRAEKPSRPKAPKPAPAPRVKKPKIPPPEPFQPTPEQVAAVEKLYLDLVSAQGEFDGIRSKIAQELSIPKKAVKQIVKALREREHIPSWWESQTYKGDTEEKEKIQNAYQPYLPIPPVGVHRLIADELDLKPGTVYQAIKTIRLELNLPQYNDPSFHAAEFEEIRRKARELKEAREAAAAAIASEASGEPVPIEASNSQEPASSHISAGSLEGQTGTA